MERALSTEGAQAAHPDFRWRMAGLRELDHGRLDLAREYLTRAARFADKPSQAMLAELLWTSGGEADERAQAYAWMDLAAERGYPAFIAQRESYWQELDESERAAAIEFGAGLYAEFGDEVAKPRLTPYFERARRQVTGRRSVSVLGTRAFAAPSYKLVSGKTNRLLHLGTEIQEFNDPRLWNAEEYWAWQDSMYGAPPRHAADAE